VARIAGRRLPPGKDPASGRAAGGRGPTAALAQRQSLLRRRHGCRPEAASARELALALISKGSI